MFICQLCFKKKNICAKLFKKAIKAEYCIDKILKNGNGKRWSRKFAHKIVQIK